MNAQQIFENRKARMLREFPTRFPGQTPPVTDEEVEYYLEEEQHLARCAIIAYQYKWWRPDETPPTDKPTVDAWFAAREQRWAEERQNSGGSC